MGKRKAHYAARIGDAICEAIALGKTLKQALAQTALAPEIRTFWRWYDEYEEFRIKYDRARQMQADVHADNMLEMAAEAVDHPGKAAGYRVAADILKWQAEIRDPKKYGSKVQHEIKAPPLAPDAVRSEIKKLEKELGIVSNHAGAKVVHAPASPASPAPQNTPPEEEAADPLSSPADAARFHDAHDAFPAPKGIQ